MRKKAVDETTLMILTHVAFPGGGSGKRGSCRTVVLNAALQSSKWAIRTGKVVSCLFWGSSISSRKGLYHAIPQGKK